jgi:hypothetical protein
VQIEHVREKLYLYTGSWAFMDNDLIQNDLKQKLLARVEDLDVLLTDVLDLLWDLVHELTEEVDNCEN